MHIGQIDISINRTTIESNGKASKNSTLAAAMLYDFTQIICWPDLPIFVGQSRKPSDRKLFVLVDVA